MISGIPISNAFPKSNQRHLHVYTSNAEWQLYILRDWKRYKRKRFEKERVRDRVNFSCSNGYNRVRDGERENAGMERERERFMDWSWLRSEEVKNHEYIEKEWEEK